MLLLIEFCLSVLAVLIVLGNPSLGDRWFAALEGRFSHFVARGRLSVVTIFVLAIGARLAVLPIDPIPSAGVHDEFSYLLMSDTFAHGRLTNPTHAMWRHFETFHVLQQPTYCSKYFPAQGVFLAFGQVVFKHPFGGVWLSGGLMCAAICWALQGWLPPSWAFLAGILAIVRLGMFSDWANSYFGGPVVTLGGALVLGGYCRIATRPAWKDAIAMAVGLAILANSRPFEGLFFAATILIALGLRLRRPPRPWPEIMRQAILPAVITITLAGIMMGYYFYRTTGSPFRFPYQVYAATYDPNPSFLWQQFRPAPAYTDPVLREFFLHWEPALIHGMRAHFAKTVFVRLTISWLFFLGPILTTPFLAALVMLRPKLRWRHLSAEGKTLCAVLGVTAIASLLSSYFGAHYVAAVTAPIYGLLLRSMQLIYESSQAGKLLTRLTVSATFSLLALRLIGPVAPALGSSGVYTWASSPGHNSIALERPQMLAKLQAQTGQQLVIVRYSIYHSIHNEWVYNDADIDASKVVWARDLGEQRNQELLNYFKNRKAWLLDADPTPPRLQPYTGAGM